MVDNEDKARCTKIDTDEFNSKERETASSKDQASTGIAGRGAARGQLGSLLLCLSASLEH